MPVIHRHNGSVATFLGEGIMVTHGVSKVNESCCADALLAGCPVAGVAAAMRLMVLGDADRGVGAMGRSVS